MMTSITAAREAGVTILSTPHDTTTAAWLSRLSTPLARFVETKFEKIGVGRAAGKSAGSNFSIRASRR